MRVLAPDDQYREQPAPARATAIKHGYLTKHALYQHLRKRRERHTARLFIV